MRPDPKAVTNLSPACYLSQELRCARRILPTSERARYDRPPCISSRVAFSSHACHDLLLLASHARCRYSAACPSTNRSLNQLASLRPSESRSYPFKATLAPFLHCYPSCHNFRIARRAFATISLSPPNRILQLRHMSDRNFLFQLDYERYREIDQPRARIQLKRSSPFLYHLYTP